MGKNGLESLKKFLVCFILATLSILSFCCLCSFSGICLPYVKKNIDYFVSPKACAFCKGFTVGSLLFTAGFMQIKSLIQNYLKYLQSFPTFYHPFQCKKETKG